MYYSQQVCQQETLFCHFCLPMAECCLQSNALTKLDGEACWHLQSDEVLQFSKVSIVECLKGHQWIGMGL